MNIVPKYVVDTCSFTTLRTTYPLDVFPGAWQAVNTMIENGILISSKEVLLELEEQDDGITEWAKIHWTIFSPLFPEIQKRAAEILGEFPNLLDLNNHKSSADAFVIATAVVNNCAVVTEEKPTGNNANIIKIPNVCKALSIPCLKIIEVFRLEQIRIGMQE